jgi:hypothetical protein
MADDLTPQRPRAAGVQEEEPDTGPGVEAARTLANDARERLHDRGFHDDQIRRWADTYIAERGSGDADAFIAWIEAEEHSS